jgi:mannose-6-phosphate isomerase
MTSKNMNLKNKPFALTPAGKDYLWGGERLNTDFHKNIPLSPLAETWECSTHPDGPSIAASGRHTGEPLDKILAEHPEYLGSHPRTLMDTLCFSHSEGIQLPVLVKLIDASQDLSVQVHPDDDYARENENGSPGKSEMWYVLDAAPDAKLYFGFNRNMDETLLRRSLEQGTIEKYLQSIPVQKDDIFFIEAGTVHAIGAGVLLAEIQESSNLTYRLYDYHRVDKSGQSRPLHIDKALEVLNYKSSDRPRQPMRVLRYRPGCASELLCRCQYFQVERLLMNTHPKLPLPDCTTTGLSFQILLCVEGEGALRIKNADKTSETLPFSKGSCLFLPANSVPVQLDGKAQLLKISC